MAHFVRWAREPEDPAARRRFHPAIDKGDLIPLGYIADRSSHSRGSTVDLTLVDADGGAELDMGTPFDFFDAISNTADGRVGARARRNRLLLKSLMGARGFVNYDKEWWHFTLAGEPFPEEGFDVPVR